MTTMRCFLFAVAVAVCAVMASSCAKECENNPRLYTVTVTAEGNGICTADPAEAEAGMTVTLTATPDEGHAFNMWTVIGGDVELIYGEDDSATFTMPAEDVAITAAFIAEKPLSEALYHELAGVWIVPQNDPYALENFRAAARNLSSGTERGDLEDVLYATHYALRIFPKNEAEQWKIELMPDVRVLYIPFNYVGLTEREAQAIDPANKGRFTDSNPNVVFYDDMRNVEGEVGDAVSLAMPILYAVWPVGKPLPSDMDYEIEYEVFLPSSSSSVGIWSRGGEWMRELEQEAIRLALGYPATVRTASATMTGATLTGEFWVWDAVKAIKVPVPRIKMRFYLGSNIVETEADADGAFSVATAAIPAAASWDIMFYNPKWKLTREGSTVPKYFIQGTVYQKAFWSSTNSHISTTIQAFDATLIKALDYFYYKPHQIQKWEDTNGIRVIANNDANASYKGMFSYNSMGACYITIYRHDISDTNILSGSLFHELGHFVHYKECGGTYATFSKIDRLLQESFANYVGWYMVEKYYTELGYVKINPGEDLSGQAAQTSWRSTTSGDRGYYSPLFVDLVDNFNQATYFGSSYNNDELKGLHYSIIREIAEKSADWASCKSILGKHIPAVELEAFLAPYEAWYAKR